MLFYRAVVFVLLSFQFINCEETRTEVDVAWDFDFDDSRMGWANATTEEMGMEFRVEDGELRASINGWSPHFDSPGMILTTTRRHYAVFRMMYFGACTRGHLLLKYGPSVSNSRHVDDKKSNWAAPQPLSIVDVSGGRESVEMLVDPSQYTAWQSNKTRMVSWVILDAQEFRWTTSLKIMTSDGDDAPRRCLLQKSVTSSAGPFVTVVDFTLEKSSKYQEIVGFSAHSRYDFTSNFNLELK
jgi:hypothetical protein